VNANVKLAQVLVHLAERGNSASCAWGFAILREKLSQLLIVASVPKFLLFALKNPPLSVRATA